MTIDRPRHCALMRRVSTAPGATGCLSRHHEPAALGAIESRPWRSRAMSLMLSAPALVSAARLHRHGRTVREPDAVRTGGGARPARTGCRCRDADGPGRGHSRSGGEPLVPLTACGRPRTARSAALDRLEPVSTGQGPTKADCLCRLSVLSRVMLDRFVSADAQRFSTGSTHAAGTGRTSWWSTTPHLETLRDESLLIGRCTAPTR